MNRKVTTYNGSEIISEEMIDVNWEELRQQRDNELQITDWRFMSDQSPSQAWIDYRKFLRDLPSNYASANEAADAWTAYDIPE